MDRVHFLDAQLWMRRATTGDWTSNGSNETASNALLLPPPVPAQANAAAAETEATAWCCFHVGARYCVFRAGDASEDQTQFQFELLMCKQRKEYQLLVRFDAQYVYVVDLRQILSVVLPKPVQQQQPQEAPPFGSLEFQNVSLRVWMDLPHGSSSMARQMLKHALVHIQHCIIKTQGQQAPSTPIGTRDDIKASWRDAFRHSEWPVDRRAIHGGGGGDNDGNRSSFNALTALQTTPTEFLKRARRILKKDADFEAVKVTCWKIFRSTRSSPRRRRKHSDGKDPQPNGGSPASEDEDEADSKCLSEMDLILLLTELAHIFGEEHDGVNELLGFSSSAACVVHDRCYELPHERVENGAEESLSKSASTCVASKWQAWDEYLEVSAQALGQPSNSRRVEDEPKSGDNKHATIFTAAAVFQRALVDEEDVATWQQRTSMQRNQINSFERVGFSACFPDRSSKRRKTQEPPAGDARHLQQQLKVEQMLAVLLEKRKQLLRDELALVLLPRRAPPLGTPSETADQRGTQGHMNYELDPRHKHTRGDPARSLAISLTQHARGPPWSPPAAAEAPVQTQVKHAKMKQENQLLLKKLHDVVARYKQLQQQYQAVVTEKEQLVGASSSSSAAAGSGADQASSEMAVQDAAVKKLETEKHELIEKLKHVVGTCRVMQKQLQEAKEENEILKSPVKPLVDSSGATQQSLSSSSNSAAFAAAARVTALEQELVEKEEEKKELVAKLQEVIARYHTLQMQLEEKIGEHEAAISKVRALELELSTKGSAEASKAQELCALEKKLEELSTQLESEQTRVSVTKEENSRLKDQLTSTIDDKQQQERDMMRQIQDAQRDNDRLVSKVSELQHQVALMQQQQEDAEQLYTEVASRLNQTLRLNGELEERLQAESSRQDHQQKAETRIQDLETLLTKAYSSAADLQSQLDSEAAQWQRERSSFVEQVNALSLAHQTASARIKHLEELQSQLEGPDLDVNYEIISPSIDFPKREEIQALAEQVNSLTEYPSDPPTVDLAAQYDEIRFQMSHIRKRQNSLLAEKENDVLELEQLRETISNLVDEHVSSLKEKDEELQSVVTKLEEDKASLQTSVATLTEKLVETEALAHRDAKKILRIRSQLVRLVGSSVAEDGEGEENWDVEQILSSVKETVSRAEEHRHTVSELTESISALQEQLSASSEQSGEAETRAERFEGEVQSLTTALQASQDENQRLNSEIDALREQIERASEESERLKQKLEVVKQAQRSHKEANSVLQEPLDSGLSFRNIVELEQELERAKSSLEQSETMMASVKAENMRMIFEVAKTADGSVKLRQDYEQLLDQQKEKALELETLMRELEGAIAAKLELENELRESQGSLTIQINELNSEKQELRDEVSRLEEDLQRLRKEKEGLEKAIADLKNENDTLEERINELNASKSDYDSTEEKDREVEELRSSLVQAKVEFEQQTRQLTALEKKVAEVTSRSGSPSHNNAAATEAERKEFHAALMELIEMEKKLQAAYETQKSLEAALKEKTESKALLEAKLADAEQSLADLEDELEHKMRVSGTIETHLKHTENENQDLMKEHEQVLAKLIQTENLLEEKSIEFEAFRTTSDMLKDERSRLFNEIALLKEQNLELEQQNERAASAQDEAQQELEEQLTELADKIAQLETDKSMMKKTMESEIFHLEDEIVEVKGWRKRAEDENLLLHSRISEFEASIQELEANSAAMEAQNAELAKELEAAHESFTLQIGEMETQVEQTMAEITMAMREKEELEVAKSALEQKLSSLEAEKSALALEFATAKTSLESNVDELQSKLTAVEQELKEAENRVAQEVALRDLEIAALSERKALLEQEVEAAKLSFAEKSEALVQVKAAEMSALLDEKTSEWRAVQSNQQEEIAKLSENLAAKQRELSELTAQWSTDKESLEQAVSHLQTQLKDAQDVAGDSQAHMQTLASEKAEIEVSLKEVQLRLQEESEKAQSRNDELQTQVETLQAQEVAFSREKESAEGKVVSLEKALEAAQASLKEADDRFAEKELVLVAASNELAELQSTQDEKTASYQALSEERASLQTQVEELQTLVRELEEQVAEKESVDEKVTSLKQALATSKSSLKEAEARLAENEAMHRALTVEHSSLQGELEGLKATVAQLQGQVTESETCAANLEQVVASSRSALQDTEELLRTTTVECKALTAEQASLQVKVSEYEALLRQLKEQVAAEKTSAEARVEETLASTKTSLQEAEERLTEKTAAYQELTERQASLQSKLEESETSIRQLEALVTEKEGVSAQVASLEEALASSEGSLKAVEDRLVEKELAFEALSTELAKLRSSHEEKSVSYLTLTEQHVALQSQLAEHESSSQQLRDELCVLQEAEAKAQVAVQEAVSALTASELRVADLTRDSDELRSSFQENEVALETLASEKSSLQAQVQEQEATVSQLQEEAQRQTLELVKSHEHATQLTLHIQELEEARAAHSQERELQLSSDLEAAQAQILTLSESVQATSDELEALRSKSDDDAAKFATTLAQRDEVVSTLKAKIEEVVASYRRLKEHAKELQERLTQQIDVCSKLTQEQEDAKAANVAQTDELSAAKQELALAHEEARSLSVELATTREQTQSLSQELSDANAKLQELQTQRELQVESFNSRVLAFEEQIATLKADSDASAKQQYDEFQKALATQRDELTLKLAELEHSKAEIVTVVQTKETEAQEVLDKMREVVTRYRELQQQHRALELAHESVTNQHESVTSTSEAELSAANATIEQLRAAASTIEAEHAVAIARVESEVQTLKLQLDVEMEAATAARTALEVYKKRAHTALKKATSESKLNVKKASEETVVLERKLLESTARVSALESELAQAQRTIAELSSGTELRIQQAVETIESERQVQEATWKSEMTVLQAELQQVQILLRAKETLDSQITELSSERDTLKREMETLKKELQQKSEMAREMMKVKDGEIAQLAQKLQAALTAAATASAMAPLRIDNNSDVGSRNPSPPARKEKGSSSSAAPSPTAHSDAGDTSRSSSVDPAEEMHSHIAAAVAENRSIPLLASASSSVEDRKASAADVDVHRLKLAKAQAAREEEALELKKQLAVLEEQASLSRKQYEDTRVQLDEANRQKKRLQLLSERNAEGVNIEYLKNVVIKYIESSNGIEKERLIPVIATVLQFSPQEMQKVSQKVQEDASAGGLLGGVFSLFGGGVPSPAPKPLASLSRQPSTSSISGGPAGFRFDEPDEGEDANGSLNPFAL